MFEEEDRIQNVKSVVKALHRDDDSSVVSSTSSSSTLIWNRSGDVEDRCVAVLLASVCGDALGSNLEFRSMDEIVNIFGYVREFKHSKQRPLGHYTDDGESMLALAKAIIDANGAPTEDVIVASYVRAYITPPRRGYGPTSSAILETLSQNAITSDKSGTMFYADGSHGNGCLMRIAPLGALAAVRKFSVDELRENVRIATRCTHSHIEALDVCLVYCVVVQRLFAMTVTSPASASSAADRLSEANRLLDMLSDVVSSLSTVAYVQDKFGVLRATQLLQQTVDNVLEDTTTTTSIDDGDDARRAKLRAIDKAFLNAVVSPCQFGELFAIRASEALIVSFYALLLSALVGPEQAMIRCVNWGGDADTIACIVGGLLGARYGGSWLPDRWVTKVEDGAEIVQMGKALAKFRTKMN